MLLSMELHYQRIQSLVVSSHKSSETWCYLETRPPTKCFFPLRHLARIKSLLSKPNLETVTHASVLSRLNYCSSLYEGLRRWWSCSWFRKQWLDLSVVQIALILVSLKWLLVKFLILLKFLFLGSQAGTTPAYLFSLLLKYILPKPLCSLDQCVLLVLRIKGKFPAFSVLAPNLWNKLPPAIKTIFLGF